MSSPSPIAVFDSGEGGLTVLKQLVQRFPTQSFIYGADRGHFPYGEKSLDDVRGWFLAFADFFQKKGASAVVIACNTATAALRNSPIRTHIPLVGVIDAAVHSAAASTKNQCIGVLSTDATYRSNIYPEQLRLMDPNIRVIAKPCPVLVLMAENGRIAGRDVHAEVLECVTPVLDSGVDTIILGCTHFPHMREVFNQVVGNRAHIVDPGETIADSLPGFVAPESGPGTVPVIRAWTTGDPILFATMSQKLCPGLPIKSRALRWDGSILLD